MPDEIDAAAAIFAGIWFTFIDISFAEDTGVAQATSAIGCIICGQAEASVLTWLHRTECDVAEGSLQARPASACEIVASCCIYGKTESESLISPNGYLLNPCSAYCAHRCMSIRFDTAYSRMSPGAEYRIVDQHNPRCNRTSKQPINRYSSLHYGMAS